MAVDQVLDVAITHLLVLEELEHESSRVEVFLLQLFYHFFSDLPSLRLLDALILVLCLNFSKVSRIFDVDHQRAELLLVEDVDDLLVEEVGDLRVVLRVRALLLVDLQDLLQVRDLIATEIQ